MYLEIHEWSHQIIVECIPGVELGGGRLVPILDVLGVTPWFALTSFKAPLLARAASLQLHFPRALAQGPGPA